MRFLAVPTDPGRSVLAWGASSHTVGTRRLIVGRSVLTVGRRLLIAGRQVLTAGLRRLMVRRRRHLNPAALPPVCKSFDRVSSHRVSQSGSPKERSGGCTRLELVRLALAPARC